MSGRLERETVRLISLFYLVMAAIALGLVAIRRDAFEFDPMSLPGDGWPVALAATIGLVLIVHLLSRLAYARLPVLRSASRDIQRLLGNLCPSQIAIVAVASGVGEELLFRGWLMNETGILVSSIIFGIVHFPPNRQWFYWPIFAFVMGLVLAWLYIWSGSLLFPVLLHVGVNYFNLRMLIRSRSRPADPLA